MKIELNTPVKVIVRPALPEVNKMVDNVEVTNIEMNIAKKLVKVTFRNIAKPIQIFDETNYPEDGNLGPAVIEARIKEVLEGQTI